jgi:hypothetical protein
VQIRHQRFSAPSGARQPRHLGIPSPPACFSRSSLVSPHSNRTTSSFKAKRRSMQIRDEEATNHANSKSRCGWRHMQVASLRSSCRSPEAKGLVTLREHWQGFQLHLAFFMLLPFHASPSCFAFIPRATHGRRCPVFSPLQQPICLQHLRRVKLG